ncbi:dTDP-4-dehydrorhamnose 3,5-epimerase family protein [Cellulomonas cellasea]|uniref:dTDP-4-dehydrorhamnose 3,5-epimerase family protein n=1 Tax=Cellulomonas cellasea TaxID=43670 RepID=UPI0025A3C2C5|nr:dTDP-4-dehydrorhamnose 3,5-epimerase family protein [Cellulomonas cellasea]MDM8083247.1 dTDP-4-dehydrorhamnose 3,5-epimerase family protein [Cellulomonas cellasea]
MDGVLLVDLEPHADDRGFFARAFDAAEFARNGLDAHVAQANVSFNHRAGTVRGMHRQIPPHAEGKLVRCTAGAIVDVALDVRPGSPTHGQHVMAELSAANRTALFVPPYVAHGYQTLVDDTEVVYQVSGPYVPGAEQGFRYDDEAFAIVWPLPVTVVSAKDAAWPLADEQVAR